MEELLEHPLYLAILDNPKDFAQYLVFADYLLEQGEDDLAFGFRYMGHNQKWPAHPNSTWWCWYQASYSQSTLPEQVYKKLQRVNNYNPIEAAYVLAMAVKTVQRELGIYS